jgi:hypothetical protein
MTSFFNPKNNNYYISLFTSGQKFHLTIKKDKDQEKKKKKEYRSQDSKQTIQKKVSTSLKKKRKLISSTRHTSKESVQRNTISLFLYENFYD